MKVLQIILGVVACIVALAIYRSYFPSRSQEKFRRDFEAHKSEMEDRKRKVLDEAQKDYIRKTFKDFPQK